MQWRDAAIIFVVVCALWEAGARAGIYPPYILPAPSAIVARIGGTMGIMLAHLVVTAGEIVGGFILAVVVGVLLAGAIVFVRFIERAIYPWLVVVQVIRKSPSDLCSSYGSASASSPRC